MKIVGLTAKRIREGAPYNENLNAIDIRWESFLSESGLTPMILPTTPTLDLSALVEATAISGFILTGGGDLVEYGGNCPDRDLLEKKCIETAIQKNLPLVGICRGMQALTHYFGGKLEKVEGHRATRHSVTWESKEREVNSFHNLVPARLPDNFEIIATSREGAVEAVRVKGTALCGVLWHPEREATFSAEDIRFFREIFFAGNSGGRE